MMITKILLAGLFAVSICMAEESSENISVTDVDGNVYRTVKIGDQVWTVENLRTTKYYDGTPIRKVTSNSAWNAAKPAYCYYDNTENSDSIKKYGALYNWYAIDTKKLAPNGWHVPTNEEWLTLEDYLIANGYNWDETSIGNKIGHSMAGGEDWIHSEYYESGLVGNKLTKSKICGFEALPGGFRNTSLEKFRMIGYTGCWWSATARDMPAKLREGQTAYSRELRSALSRLENTYDYINSGLSVRLVKDYDINDLAQGESAVRVVETDTEEVAQDSKRISVKDINGNVYQAVKIGEQVWTVENLRATKLNDGKRIFLAADKDQWNSSQPMFCYSSYTTKAEKIRKFGAYYNWAVVATGKLAPKGWHIPTWLDWKILEYYLGTNGYNWDGTTTPPDEYMNNNKIAKSMAVEKYWNDSDKGGAIGNKKFKSKKCGFSALPGGFVNTDGFFQCDENIYGTGYYGWWWDASGADCHALYSDNGSLASYQKQSESNGYTVRLVKDYASQDSAYNGIEQGGAERISVTDVDGNEYQAAKIGDQVWTIENLRTTKFNDGTSIRNVTKTKAWQRLSSPGYCFYNNTINADSMKKFGALYNWYTVDTKKLAPKGWHVPSKAEWEKLKKHLITNGYNWDGTTSDNKIAFSMAIGKYWAYSTHVGSLGFLGFILTKGKKCGFSALPGGYREDSKNPYKDDFMRIGTETYWWSTTASDDPTCIYSGHLNCGRDLLEMSYCFNMKRGLSVRLVKDTISPQESSINPNNVGSSINPNNVGSSINPNNAGSSINPNNAGSSINQNIGQIAQSEPEKTTVTISVTDSVTDADGNVYKTVKIGEQIWTIDNLRTTKYNTGESIPLEMDSSAWTKTHTTPGYCYYNNTTNADSIKKYGAIYNWYVVDTKKLAPKGWHVPDDSEWKSLENYLVVNGFNLNGNATDKSIAKSMVIDKYWKNSEVKGSIGDKLTKCKKSMFSALPGGFRDITGLFVCVGEAGYFWSSNAADWEASFANLRSLQYNDDISFLHDSYNYKSFGCSVRLVKDSD